MDDLSPYSRAANAMEGIGAMGIFFGVIAIAGTFLAWLDIGAWTSVVYWFAAGSVGTTLAGIGLFGAGYRWNKRCRQRWEAWRRDYCG